MYAVSFTSTYHGVTDLVNHGMFKKIQDLNIFETELNFSIKIIFLTCASDKFLEVSVL